jgi:hypothetical protein
MVSEAFWFLVHADALGILILENSIQTVAIENAGE